ncbi:TIM protein, partial [Zapornia atra]|nr:TIM protein [Zapornia atra]
PVPLVPLTEENEDAMEDRRFRSLLRQLGLRPPANEQESFWRIPAALRPQQLRRLAASIAQPGPNPPRSPQGLQEPPRYPQDSASAAEQLPSALGSDSDSEEPVPVPSPGQPRTKRRRELDSEEEEEEEEGGDGSPGGFSPSAQSWG